MSAPSTPTNGQGTRASDVTWTPSSMDTTNAMGQRHSAPVRPGTPAPAPRPW